ncbi:PaaI family thioesterase [Allopusillimonas soli]|uniref:PaaI family thioesterase n=1 Tax=Allopusillimonas soli TaxID=659016 RepID=A0A853FBT7_9BURK|nr:PaaI family thioesterase [Allopusillimonas soli]NYT36011.1 PaaI family thioesterase [Allopusillimonas soli]TEA76355.1 PaaI family thioesterase [Allopusillimonas soli]
MNTHHALPAGFVLRDHPSDFMDLCGPFYDHIVDGQLEALAVQVQEKHRNLRAIGHGGFLMTVADSALGDAVAQHYDGQGLVTVSLSSDFYKPAQVGDWIIARCDVQRAGRRIAYAECFLYINDEKVFRASGVFAVVQSQGRR